MNLRLLTIGTAFCTMFSYSIVTAADAQTKDQQTQDQQSQVSQEQSSQEQNAQASNQPSQNNKQQSQAARQKMKDSRAAAKMLNETDQARQALANKDQDKALESVDQALKTAAKLESMASRNGNVQMIPIFTEWESSTVVGPVVAEQNRSGHQRAGAQAQADRSQTGSADRESNPPSSRTNEAVRDVAGEFTTIAVDAKMAENHLQAAKQALENSDPQKADAALAAVQDSVILASSQSDLPLVKARENLALACQAVQNHNYDEASTALQAAGRGLSEYANSNSGSSTQQVQQLKNQIDSYASSIQNSHQNAQDQIQGWWNEVASLMQHPATARNQQSPDSGNQQFSNGSQSDRGASQPQTTGRPQKDQGTR